MTVVAIANRLGYRASQLCGYLIADVAPALPQGAQDLLLPGTIEVFRQLSTGDQRHLLAVHALLRDQEAGEDVLCAGLLHDIGKVYNGQRIGLVTRCLKVVMDTLAPEVLARIIQGPAPPWWGTGLWIAGRHAHIGDQVLRALGYPARVCWLVAHHEETALGDIDLAQLRAADNSRPAIPRR